MKRFCMILVLATGASSAWAQDTPAFDAGTFIRQYDLHVWSGYTTLLLAASTGTAAAFSWDIHPVLGFSTMTSGAVTLALGLTAYGGRLEEIWPHALFMGLAETAWLLNAFVWEPGSLPHRITGVSSLVCLGLGYLSIRLIQG